VGELRQDFVNETNGRTELIIVDVFCEKPSEISYDDRSVDVLSTYDILTKTANNEHGGLACFIRQGRHNVDFGLKTIVKGKTGSADRSRIEADEVLVGPLMTAHPRWSDLLVGHQGSIVINL
jgi:hypothetical protein